MIKYFKTLWENNITPVNGRNLNKIEDALEYLYDVIRNVPSEENIRIANEKQRQQDETTRSNSEVKRNATFDSKIKDVDKAINASNENIKEVNNKFEMITASKQQDAEIIIARDGEISLNARIERDVKKGKLIEETKTGEYLTFDDTVDSIISSIELHGNTIQNPNTLEIKSAGIDNGDGTFKMSILSCGENLFNKEKLEIGTILPATGQDYSSDTKYRTSYIRISGNSSIRVSNIGKDNYLYFYDTDKKFIKITDIYYEGDVPQGAVFIRVICNISDNINIIKVQEGTVATPYTPYQETRCDIKLPCQLEKWDRLYFDKEENAWCVDKVNNIYTFLGTEPKVTNVVSKVNTYEICLAKKPMLNITNASMLDFSDKFKCFAYPSGRDQVGMFSLVYTDIEIYVYIPKNEFGSTPSASEFMSKLASYNASFHYQVENPQKIVLPQSEQIKLNSFANKTHIYTISGDVDATVKATVSKSLASTVQANTEEINILNGKIEDIQGLKESQDFAYETDKGYLVCKDTQNGVVKDLKVYGKSLVNLFDNNYPKSYNGQGENMTMGKPFNLDSMLEPNTLYTIIIFDETGKVSTFNPYTLTSSNTVINGLIGKITTRNDLANAISRLHVYPKSGMLFTEDDKAKIKAVILKGDYTQNPPPFFEGIASVGNGNEIEVLSTNGNLFTGEFISEYATTHTYNGVDLTVKGEWYSKFNLSNLPKNTDLVMCATREGSDLSNAYVRIYYSDGTYIDNSLINNYFTFNTKNGVSDVNFYCSGGNGVIKTVIFKNVGIYLGKENKQFVQHRQDKKTILFKDADNTWKPILNLRGIDENNCDIFDSVNNKLDVKYIDKIVDGTENITIMKTKGTNTLFKVELNVALKPNAKILCDKYKTISYYDNFNSDVVGVSSYDLQSRTYIAISDISSTVEDFKNKLKINNLNLILEVNNPKSYEINPIFPNSYENETMISFGSGVIAPHAEWKITSSLPNFVKELSNQIKQLQDQVYKTNVANFTVALNTLDTKMRLEQLEASK